jgi:hypothetical protein
MIILSSYFIIIFYVHTAQPNVIIPDTSVSKSTRRKWLHDICYQFVGEYVFNSNKIVGLVNKTADLEQKFRAEVQILLNAFNSQFICSTSKSQKGCT